MRRMLVLASALLAVALPAGAQTLRTGVSQSQCSALGGRFTATSTAGQYTVDTGECYVPPRSSGTTTFQVPRGGGNAGAVLGGVAAMLSLGAAVADMAGGFPAATSPTPGAQTHSLTAPGNTAALQTVPNASQPGPSNDPDSLAMLAALDSLGRTRPDEYYLPPPLGNLANEAGIRSTENVIGRISRACNGKVGLAQMDCVNGEINEALMERVPAIGRKCGTMVEPYRGLCAANEARKANALQPHSCIGNPEECPQVASGRAEEMRREASARMRARCSANPDSCLPTKD